ncbi:hypothetical protein C900_04434 [Fulvivirga imtechensis AK7]|uniref:Lipoprotein n=1 Tax=Fulvivirga imtechensis AK7 TaxID=1237149 RepID=L8JMF0_9BACT|nr:hypothetical protein [Fulvivirga imtechensis]ELR69990.1 hypothetical protein C900_04434 [Fulvivirga imtechensis AK7]
MGKILLSLTLAFIAGCASKPSELSWTDYQEWLQKNGQAVAREKVINDLKLRAQFLPADFLAYSEYEQLTSAKTGTFDSLLKEYKCGLSFKLSLLADKQTTNLMYHGISTMNEYKQRVSLLSFNSEQFIALNVGDDRFKPVLTAFEGYNELSNRLTFSVVFTPDGYHCGVFDEHAEELTLTFDDPYWGTGTSHFLFRKSDIQSIPKLIIAKRSL